MKIKEKLKSIPQMAKKGLEKFPVTIIAIMIFTVFLAIVTNNEKEIINSDIVENITLFTMLFGLGSFFAEAMFEKINIKRILTYIGSAIISAILVYFLQADFAKNINETLSKISFCYSVTLFILAIYFIIKKYKKDLKEYLLKLFINYIKISAIYGVLALGIAIVSSIFVYLFMDNTGYFIVSKIEILLLGFYYIPKLIYCLVDVENQVNVFFKGLIKYVLTSLVIIAFVIIYLYMLKILILRDMPKNQIFRILSTLFIIGMPIWTMAQYFKDESFWYKITTKLPFAFIPFIFLQMYTIGIRIADNGVTPLRYTCVALIIFEIIYTLIYIFKKERIEVLLLIGNAIIIISLIVPGVNMFRISDVSQAQSLKLYINKSEYTDEDKDKIYGAYSYLKSSENGEKYINEILDEEDIVTVKSFNNIASIKGSSKYIQGHKVINSINTEGYKMLYIISSKSSDSNKLDEAFRNVEIEKKDENNTKLKVDLTQEFKKYIEISNENELNNYLKENNEIEIDDNTKLIIKSIYFNYSEEANIIERYSISGYLLEGKE